MRSIARSATALFVVVLAAGLASAGAPLHEAASNGNLQKIDEVIASGVKVDTLKWKAWSALSYAAKKGQLEAVKHLVEVHGANVDHAGGVTTTPLYMAAGAGRREIAEYLVRKGADADMVEYLGKGKKRAPYSARLVQPTWPWDRWVGEVRAEQDRAVDQLLAERAERQAAAQAAAEQERLDKLRARWERDAVLPVEVRKDKYMLALRRKLDEGDHDSALVYCDFLRRLDVPLEPTFDLYHGQILLETGQTDEALDRLYAFVQHVGVGDPNYTRALELINGAEGR